MVVRWSRAGLPMQHQGKRFYIYMHPRDPIKYPPGEDRGL